MSGTVTSLPLVANSFFQGFAVAPTASVDLVAEVALATTTTAAAAASATAANTSALSAQSAALSATGASAAAVATVNSAVAAATASFTAAASGVTGTTPVIAAAATTPRSFAARFSDRMSVLDFGVQGGGVDDTAAYQAAINACAGKCVLLHPAGLTTTVGMLTFRTGSQLEINGTVFLKAGADNHVFMGDPAGVSNVIFSGHGVIDGNRANNTTNSSLPYPYAGGIVTGTFFAAPPSVPNSGIVIRGLTIQNVINWPVSLFGTLGALVEDCTMTDSGNAPQFVCGTSYCKFLNNTFARIADYAPAFYEGVSYGEAAGNTSTDCSCIGILNDGTPTASNWSGTPCHDISVHHNKSVRATFYGVIVNNITGTTGANPYNIDIFDNTILDSGMANAGGNAGGIMVLNANRVRVRGNLIRGGGTASSLWYGISGGGADGCSIIGNHISNGGRTVAGGVISGCTAVGIGPLGTRTRYEDNVILDDDPTTHTMAWGFGYSVTSGVIHGACRWVNNHISNMVSGAFQVAAPFLTDTYVFGALDNSSTVWCRGLLVAQGNLVVDGTTTVSGTVNSLSVGGGNTAGSGPYLSAIGTDANVTLGYYAQGTGTHAFHNPLSVAGTITATGTVVAQAGANVSSPLNVFGAANNIGVSGSASGVAPAITAFGSDANVDINYVAKAGGNHYFNTGVSAAHYYMGGTGGVSWASGAGVPSYAAPIGSMFSRTDGGVGSTLYVSRGGGTWNAVAGV